MLVSWSSGRLKERTWHITISTLVAVASFIVATSVENTAGRYAGMIIFCIGTYGVNSLMLGRCGSARVHTRHGGERGVQRGHVWDCVSGQGGAEEEE
ncbi:hypothetical protein ACKVWH_002060 [Pyricularia oryzae]